MTPRSRRWLQRLNPFATPRSVRTWVVDSSVFAVNALALLYWFSDPYVESWPIFPQWWVGFDIGAGVVAVLALWWLRRYPVPVAVVLAVLGGFFLAGGLPALTSVFTVAVRRPFKVAVGITAIHVAISVPYHLLFPLSSISLGLWGLLMMLVYGLVLSVGLAVRSRRQVIHGLVESAERDRRDYEERLLQVRESERTRIAREMHDVLAHRLSLLSVHAGALEYRTGAEGGERASDLEVREAVAVIRESAHHALEELHEVLSVLGRSEPEEGVLGTAGPQPQLSNLPTLVREAERADQVVRLRQSIAPGEALRGQVQRTIYRVVQEGLTNARKHATGAAVEVVVSGGPESGVRVEVRNTLPIGTTSSEIPGAGTGLTGLAERVALDGGTQATDVVDGVFVLRVELPWRT